jgi:hypothetical protein
MLATWDQPGWPSKHKEIKTVKPIIEFTKILIKFPLQKSFLFRGKIYDIDF